MQGSNNAAKVRGSFHETATRKTSEHTVKHRDGCVGSVLANHRGEGESLVVVTTLQINPRTNHQYLTVSNPASRHKVRHKTDSN